MPEPLLVVRHVSKSFSGVKAVRDVSFTIERGKIYSLVGENGSGKSTLIKIISGVCARDHGDVVFDGTSYDRLRPIESILEGVHVIYQDFSLFPNLSVAENVAITDLLARKKRLVNWKELHSIALEALEKIQLEIDPDQTVDQLTVAEKQLVSIAKALQQNARLIVMDEPTTALTGREINTLFAVIKRLCENDGVSFLFVSHKLNEVLEISEHIFVMRNGTKMMDGESTAFDYRKLVYLMTGRKEEEPITENAPRPETKDSLLRVSNLSRQGAFFDISFDLAAGEMLGFAGVLGSGRTPLALALFGLRPAETGSIFIYGEPAHITSVQDALSYNIAYVPEDRLTEGLFLSQSVGHNVIVRTIESALSTIGFIDKKRKKELIRQWLDKLAIQTTSPDQPVITLSGGNQQRVVLAKWLATSPKIFILNGPTVGVDVGSKSEIHKVLKVLARNGMGLIIISDDIPELIHLCDRILLFKKGCITDEFEGQALTEQQLGNKLVDV